MSDDTDFVSMYEELGLGAECGMAAFKQAYRRRVAVLHPDTHGEASDLPRLQRLNRLYEAALDFHRVHGRLPGAPAVPQRPHAPRLERIAPALPADDDLQASPPTRRRYLLIGALLAVVLYWLGANRTSTPTLDPGSPAESASAAWQPRSPKQLELGMDVEQARRILGDPSVEHAARWEYGPSWVDIECGRVAGWYSAPARPLYVARDSAQLEGPRGPSACG